MYQSEERLSVTISLNTQPFGSRTKSQIASFSFFFGITIAITVTGLRIQTKKKRSPDQ